ncbi:MAG: DUF2752 domain-containing protein [Lachnospiraceae bacterium]|jgi:hypothetical protein|nr:DUF2752 domain-containing protein [Lachnospiraceae bacterium]
MKNSSLVQQMKNGFKMMWVDLKKINPFLFAIIILYFVGLNVFFDTGCLFKALFGIPCPGCGLTRAGMSLFLLDFKGAWEYNPIIYPVIFFIALLIIYRYFLKRKLPLWIGILGGVIIAVAIIYYIYRMKTYFPYDAPKNSGFFDLHFNHYGVDTGKVNLKAEPMVYNENNLINRIFHLINKMSK